VEGNSDPDGPAEEKAGSSQQKGSTSMTVDVQELKKSLSSLGERLEALRGYL
jgi:hypothetical protein